MTRAQRSAHRVVWSGVGLLVTTLALWALAQRSRGPIDSSDTHTVAPVAGVPAAGGEADR